MKLFLAQLPQITPATESQYEVETILMFGEEKWGQEPSKPKGCMMSMETIYIPNCFSPFTNFGADLY